MNSIKDIVCQVFAGQKSKGTIDLVLHTFIPAYDKLHSAYASRPDDPNYVFKTEDEMINYFLENKGIEQTFYWNQLQDNPRKIMVGAHITGDDNLIMSLTIDGDEEMKQIYFDRLKALLKSDIGVISYTNPAGYENGQDFLLKYGDGRA